VSHCAVSGLGRYHVPQHTIHLLRYSDAIAKSNNERNKVIREFVSRAMKTWLMSRDIDIVNVQKPQYKLVVHIKPSSVCDNAFTGVPGKYTERSRGGYYYWG